MMVVKYWDSSFELSRRMEFRLWRRSDPFVFFGGTLQFGLAKAAVEMGFEAEIYQKARFSQCYPNMGKLPDFLEYIISLDARSKDVAIHYGRKVSNVIFKGLINGIPPIVFLSLRPISGENVLHWLVVTGFDGQRVYVNDPYVPEGSMMREKKGYPIDLDVFCRAIATDMRRVLRLPPCTLLVHT